MDINDREELAAAFAGFHNLFGLLVKRLTAERAIDIAELLIDLDHLMAEPCLHPVTIAVQEDCREVLIGVLVRGPHAEPEAIQKDELLSVAPLRQSPGFEHPHGN